MLSQIAVKNAAMVGTLECVSYSGYAQSYAELWDTAVQVASYLEPTGVTRVGLHLTNPLFLVTLMVALDHMGAETFLFHEEDPPETVAEKARNLGLHLCLRDQDFPSGLSAIDPSLLPFRKVDGLQRTTRTTGAANGLVVLFTSGTTGGPKGVVHDWSSLVGSVRADKTYRGNRWLSIYGLTRFAGINVFLHAFVNGGRLTVPTERSLPALLKLALDEKVTHVSATPSFWHNFLMNTSAKDREELGFQQITLGGEAARQPLLNALKRAFPGARVSHTYASTESGFCLAASDGLEGYPMSSLRGNERGVQLKIVGDELWVSSPYSMKGYLNEHNRRRSWVRTGDAVEIRVGRLFVLGRQQEVINVGGNKVNPGEVESVIMHVAGVQAVRVYGRRSSVMGEVVKAEIVAASKEPLSMLRDRIKHQCDESLMPYQVPRMIEFVDHIPVSVSGKTIRGHE